MAGHTEGPWEVWTGTKAQEHHHWKNRACVSSSRRDDFGEPYSMLVAYTDFHTSEIAEANARLIAAAPDMLEALKQAKEYHDRDAGQNGFTAEYELLRRDIDAAIARAEATK